MEHVLQVQPGIRMRSAQRDGDDRQTLAQTDWPDVDARTLLELTAYVADRKRDGKPTIKQTTSWKTLQATFGPLRPAEIDKGVCYSYWDLRAAGGWSKSTIWTDLSVLRACLGWAVEMEKLPKAPFIWLSNQPPPRDRYLTRYEADRLIAAAELPHLRLFILLALYTGARKTAILELEWSRVDFDEDIINSTPRHPRATPISAARSRR